MNLLVVTQRHRHPDDGPNWVRRRFERCEVAAASGRLAPDDLLRPGTDVWFYREPAPETPVPFSIPTIFEDDDLLVVDKPPFLATMPRGRHITETALVRLRRFTGNPELSPAHRLDRLTSGVLLFTKHRRVRGVFQRLFAGASKQLEKQYDAIAPLRSLSPTTWADVQTKRVGELQATSTPACGEAPNAVTDLLSVTPLDPAEQAAMQRRHGLPSGSDLARYALRPRTGRTHQLRRHMMDYAAPILGDPIYPQVQEEPDPPNFSRPLELVARRLRFTDPRSGVDREFVSHR